MKQIILSLIVLLGASLNACMAQPIKNMKFMKQIILSLIVLLGASLNACMAKDNQTSETRNISGYTSIRIDGVATVRFAQSDTWSCRIEGKAEERANGSRTFKVQPSISPPPRLMK